MAALWFNADINLPIKRHVVYAAKSFLFCVTKRNFLHLNIIFISDLIH